jgi:hypothetical protein
VLAAAVGAQVGFGCIVVSERGHRISLWIRFKVEERSCVASMRPNRNPRAGRTLRAPGGPGGAGVGGAAAGRAAGRAGDGDGAPCTISIWARSCILDRASGMPARPASGRDLHLGAGHSFKTALHTCLVLDRPAGGAGGAGGRPGGGRLGGGRGWASIALPLRTTTHPLYTRCTNIFGASISEATMRPNSRRGAVGRRAPAWRRQRRHGRGDLRRSTICRRGAGVRPRCRSAAPPSHSTLGSPFKGTWLLLWCSSPTCT